MWMIRFITCIHEAREPSRLWQSDHFWLCGVKNWKPPHGEAPHGDGEVLHINPTTSTRLKQSIMSANRLPCGWEAKGERFEWPPHGLPMASPWPPHGDGEVWHINPTTSTHFKQLIMSGDRLPCAWKQKGERFEWSPHGLPMTSPWPPHGDGEAPHGEKKKTFDWINAREWTFSRIAMDWRNVYDNWLIWSRF